MWQQMLYHCEAHWELYGTKAATVSEMFLQDTTLLIIAFKLHDRLGATECVVSGMHYNIQFLSAKFV